MKISRWVVIPDMQVPYHDKRADLLLRQYLADHRWDGAVNLGDFIDFDEISHWTERSAKMDKAGAIAKSYEAAAAVLDGQLAALRGKNPAARYVLLEGNHEDRITQYIDKHPECEGLVEVPVGLDIRTRRVEWVPSWSTGKVFRIGKASFIHGHFTRKHHAAAHLEDYDCNIYYGHLHTIQLHSRRTRGKNETKEAMCMGCLCRADLGYLKGRPTDWQLAFGVFHFLPNGNYQRYIVRIFNYTFVSPEGKVYKA